MYFFFIFNNLPCVYKELKEAVFYFLQSADSFHLQLLFVGWFYRSHHFYLIAIKGGIPIILKWNPNEFCEFHRRGGGGDYSLDLHFSWIPLIMSCASCIAACPLAFYPLLIINQNKRLTVETSWCNTWLVKHFTSRRNVQLASGQIPAVEKWTKHSAGWSVRALLRPWKHLIY